MKLYDKIQVTAKFIQEYISQAPEICIILGTGLGGLTDIVEKEAEIPYSDIPFFPDTTVKGHKGTLVLGKMNGKQVMMMAGRFHYYEGYSMEEITFPIRVANTLGAHTLIVSNAAGGMNPSYKTGDLMIINDHINLFPEHPLRGHNDDRLGPRFPDMSEPYNIKLIEQAQKIAADNNLPVHTGVYAGLQGPTFETKAEYRMLYKMGADAVGMSSVPEALVALHGGMKVFAASIITDMWKEEMLHPLTLEEVIQAAGEAAPKLAALIGALVANM